MLGNPKLLKTAAAEIARLGMAGLQEVYKTGPRPQEPEITNGILFAIYGGLLDGAIAGLRWHPMILPSKGKGAAEKLYGADALIVLDIRDGARHMQKGVLIQSKMAHRKDKHLPEQCAKMLKLTPAAFVFKFCKAGTMVEPATKYDASQPRGSEGWSFEDFIYGLLSCAHGDHEFKAATLLELKKAADRVNTPRALLLKADSP